MGEWVPVSEKLPDERIKPRGYGLCAVLVSSFCCRTIPKVTTALFVDGRFLGLDATMHRDLTKEVTAWMYLPEPYT